MKKQRRRNFRRSSKLLRKAASRVISLGAISTALVCAIVWTAPRAHANTEIDRQFSLETIGFLKSWDNVDGLFADYVASAYKEYFAGKTRFILHDLSKGDTILSKSKLPYQKLIEDPEILGQLSRATKTQSIIRTKIQKEGPQYRFNLEWLHSPMMEVMAKHEFFLKQTADAGNVGLGDVKGELQRGLDALLAKVPFQGHVTGRDNNSVTINLGGAANLKKGDTLVISTLDEAKKHPLLKEIVDWRLTPIGKVEVDQVEDSLTFARVIEEEPSAPIGRFQKVTQVIPKAPGRQDQLVINEKEEHANKLQEPPTLGWVSGGLWMGSYSRQYTNNSNANFSRNGSGFVVGSRAEGQIWLNREWFVDLAFGFGLMGYTQSDLNGTATLTSTSANFTNFRGDLGYTYFLSPDFFGPKGWVKLGYRSSSYNLPSLLPPNSAERVAPIGYSSLFIGLGGELPVRGDFGFSLNLDFGLLPSMTEATGGTLLGASNSVNDLSFFVGGFYRFNQRLSVKAGIDVIGQSSSHTAANVNQKVVTFAPSLLYYF